MASSLVGPFYRACKAHIRIHIYIYTHVYLQYLSISIYIYVCIYQYIYIHMYVYIYILTDALDIVFLIVVQAVRLEWPLRSSVPCLSGNASVGPCTQSDKQLLHSGKRTKKQRRDPSKRRVVYGEPLFRFHICFPE